MDDGPADNSRHDVTRALHIHGESVTRAVRRACEKAGIDDVHLHDLRTAMTTFLAEAGVDESVLRDVMHHTAQGVTNRHYNRSVGAERLRDARQKWGDDVEGAVTQVIAA